jgi:hypothetical protein
MWDAKMKSLKSNPKVAIATFQLLTQNIIKVRCHNPLLTGQW